MVRVWNGLSLNEKYVGQDENSKNKTVKSRMKNEKDFI